MLYRYINPYSHSCIHGPLYKYIYLHIHVFIHATFYSYTYYTCALMCGKAMLDRCIYQQNGTQIYIFIYSLIHAYTFIQIHVASTYLCLQYTYTRYSIQLRVSRYLSVDPHHVIEIPLSMHPSIHLHILMMVYRYIWSLDTYIPIESRMYPYSIPHNTYNISTHPSAYPSTDHTDTYIHIPICISRNIHYIHIALPPCM